MKSYYLLISCCCLGLFLYSVYIINSYGDWSRLKYGLFSLLVSGYFVLKARRA